MYSICRPLPSSIKMKHSTVKATNSNYMLVSQTCPNRDRIRSRRSAVYANHEEVQDRCCCETRPKVGGCGKVEPLRSADKVLQRVDAVPLGGSRDAID